MWARKGTRFFRVSSVWFSSLLIDVALGGAWARGQEVGIYIFWSFCYGFDKSHPLIEAREDAFWGDKGNVSCSLKTGRSRLLGIRMEEVRGSDLNNHFRWLCRFVHFFAGGFCSRGYRSADLRVENPMISKSPDERSETTIPDL